MRAGLITSERAHISPSNYIHSYFLLFGSTNASPSPQHITHTEKLQSKMASFFLPSTRFSVMMQSALVLLSFISFAVAISDEYKGFLHYHNSDVTQDKILLDASDLKLSGSVWSAVCDDLEECVAFNDAGYLKGFPHNKSVDAYISKKNCGSHGPAKVINGSCLSPNSSYVKCHDDKGHMDTFYNIKGKGRKKMQQLKE